ncbi:hypothetical protein P167DRAFT_152656 [Morchella conica CCBAS932]|uniref:Uncharacterized protein n=1 Tax=Morchella conica CCBAS932 TaxID=1392247 RepID=A0A3N4KTI3_9PEZI|nr:hypothetical protein P167DRAFT_152656 [Morchella conica CCBAS932]
MPYGLVASYVGIRLSSTILLTLLCCSIFTPPLQYVLACNLKGASPALCVNALENFAIYMQQSEVESYDGCGAWEAKKNIGFSLS